MRHRLSSTFVDDVLTWDQVVLISSLIAGYDINFSRWIQAGISKRAFRELNTILFPCLVQRLYDMAGVLFILEVDHGVKANHMANIRLIKDNAKPIVLYRAQPLTSSGVTHFERPFVSVELVNRLYRVEVLIQVASG